MKIFTKSLSFIIAFLFCVLYAQAQTADFSMDRTSGCDPLVVVFTNKSTGTITSYYWEFGDSKTSALPNPSTTYTSPGTYTVKLTVRNGSGPASTKTATVTVYPSPTVTFTASPVKACPCTEITFTNTSTPNAPGAYTSIWSFGDGYTATTNNTSHVYCTPGKYNVALKVTNSAGCESAKVDTAKVEIMEKPVGNFYASKTSLCKVPDTVTFTNLVSKGKAPYSFEWDLGVPPVSTASSPTQIYSSPGTYTVKMIVTDANGCKDTVLKTNYITASTMNSDFTVPSSICAGVSMVRFDNVSTPTPVQTRWIWSDGGGAYGSFAQRDFWKGGTVTVTMIDSFGPGCKDTAEHNYTAYPKPKPSFSYWPIYPCPAPVDVHFTNLSRGADSFTWVFGDGTTSKLKDPVHTYTKDSVFTVWMIAKTDKGCLDTFRVRDTTKDFPGGYPSKFYDSSNSPIIVRVFNGYMDIKKVQDSSCIPAVAKFSVKLKTDVHLPSTVDTTTPIPVCGPILGYNLPYWYCSMVGAFPDPYPDPYYDSHYPMVSGPDKDKYPYLIKRWHWDFGDGFTSTMDTPSHTFTTEGVHRIICTVWTDSCMFVDTIYTEAGYKPHADFSFTPAVICKGDYVYFTNLSTGGLKYVWDYADGFSDETEAPDPVQHRYRVAGDRRVVLTASRYGCPDTMSKLLIINPPASSFGMKYSCDTPLKVRFLDSSYRATSVYWEFGDGGTSTARNPVHIYASAGTYTVKMMTANDTFSCKDTSERVVELFFANPVFSANSGCLGDTTFILHTNPNYIIDYAFSSAVPVIADPYLPRHYAIYKDTGLYTIRMITKDAHGCFDTVTKTDYVTIAKPRMRIVADPPIACAPATINFFDSSTNVRGVKNVTRTWYWGDATFKTDTSIKASKLFSSPGSYSVLVVTTDAMGCVDSARIMIESSKPKAGFTYDIDTYTCMGRTVKFYSSSSTGSDLTFKWYFGDGGTSTAANPTYVYSTVGTFNVKLVVTDKAGCKDSLTKMGYIKTTQPVAAFDMDDSVALCPPLFVHFKNMSTNAVRYEWDFANSSTSTASDPITPYIDKGVYVVMLVAYDKHGCTDTAYKRARVLGYAGAFKYSPLSGCAPHTVNFEADLVDAEVMVWDFADGITESAVGKPKTSHTYMTPGKYVPRLILGDGKGCSTSSQGLDTIKVDGVDADMTVLSPCVGSEATFTDVSQSFFSAYTSSEWTFEDGSTKTGKSPTRTYAKAGSYPVRLISTNANGCKDTVYRNVVIYDLPFIKAKDTVICYGDQATLSATGGTSYTWLPDPTLNCTNCNNPVTSTKSPRRYYVRGTDEHGCSNMDTLDVGIKTKTTLILAENADVCKLDSIRLLASGAQKYYWSPDKYLSSTEVPDPLVKADSSIIYRVIGVEGSCVPDTGFLKLTVHPLPEVNAGEDQKVLAGTEVQLNGSGKSVKEYLWTPATSLSCVDCANPVAKPLLTTTYTLKGTTEFGCSDSDDVIITVFCDQSQLFIPNTFTPNGDGVNDYFYPQGQGVGKIKSFIIYNRWGQKVFERTGMDANAKEQGWDGTFNGDALSPDTFVYTLEATCDNGDNVFWKGDITLIK